MPQSKLDQSKHILRLWLIKLAISNNYSKKIWLLEGIKMLIKVAIKWDIVAMIHDR